ncbi:MAG: carboxymuconolactone decarboxylase [Parvibaculum sp.]|jgi:alkylhydroperoxidase family enzyme|uniref:carboxymuconolactone decarboxylase family protein n=1 Tax=Parvibaculum sp. TaxID=2024848 RepID=UPI000C54A8FD|nr:carboxymuconolactone decarboxylase family protein [Parvibaculum sp.]MAU60827.1 carboxymuconolactone decarboxylase [Parvibaculum sp.]HAC57828.1 carboxymuconolactone decarboxylase family protein [Rhodobiaceae bacterium]|tara:strand:- start:510 stop:1076 length:567 start_codon:yes stop_codon:yes gene_type:complete
MARIPYPDPAKLPAEARDLLESLPQLNIFRMIAGSGASFLPFMAFINSYLNAGVLEPELRELVILRVGHLCKSNYELHQHRRVSRMIGMSEERIAASAGALPSPLFSEAENAALLFTDDQVAHVKADGKLFADAHEYLGDTGMQELVIVIGTYLLVCRYLETFEIDLEERDIETSGLDEIRRGLDRHG